ncbi:hypothetical protein EP30_10195 [Bifidobacterium sp. UTCIF-39]|uniref:hypothetical protein n=1 Tax=Bifidobacterium sp. UTCIF-39 TaxID=1465359 RepID=UPI00112D2E71|nr:hypothetical protein [Bifidobacterium sp. UTCIF-39]TPF95732.1 hypothetical protein EP30_10195 [Bifidobacterium sp. UTCIF-39]
MTAVLLILPSSASATTTEIKTIPATMRGMDAYLSRETNGTITLDAAAAKQEGYSSEAINHVTDNLSEMNEMIAHGATSDDSFTVTAFSKISRAGGQSKVVRHWTGLTEIYLNSSEAEELAKKYDVAADAAGYLSGFLFKWSVPAAGALAASAIYYTSAAQIRAYNKGKGVIICMMPNTETGGYITWVTSQ